MSLSINRAEFDKNFTPLAKERHSASYLQGLEIRLLWISNLFAKLAEIFR
jgi:hypothetical protein